MAIFNEILVGRFNRGLQKYFGIKGTAPIRQVAGEIQPSHPLFSGAENRFLEGWNRYGVAQQVAAIAAQQNVVRIRNPVTSNVIAVFEAIVCYGATANQPTLQHQASGADLSIIAFSAAMRWDPRGGDPATGGGSSSLVLSLNTAGVPAVTFFVKKQIATAAGVSQDFIQDTIQEVPLLPGDVIQVQSNNVNEIFNASFMWRERFLEEAERK